MGKWYKISALSALLGFGSFASDQSEVLIHAEKPNGEFDSNLTMQEAYKKGAVDSISDYLTKAEKSKYVALTRDTVVIDRNNIGKRICLGAYLDYKDSVYIHILIPDTTGASEDLKRTINRFTEILSSDKEVNGVMAHELKHKDTVLNLLNNNLSSKQKNMTIVLRADFSPEDVILYNQHNEISARVATVIQQREEYIKTGDLNSFSGFAKQYRDAIERGVFAPGKMSDYQNELENAYILKVVFDWWQDNERKANIYVNKQKLSTWFKYGKKKSEQRNFLLYKRILDIAYTYIKDDRLVCMNYFCSPFGVYTGKVYTVQDIENLMKETRDLKLLRWCDEPVYLQDAEPQKEVLDMIPYLREQEKARLLRDHEKIEKRKKEKQAAKYEKYSKEHQTFLSKHYSKPENPRKKQNHTRPQALIYLARRKTKI